MKYNFCVKIRPMVNGAERLYPRQGENNFIAGLQTYKYIGEVAFLHARSSLMLRREGVKWYPVGSFLIPLFEDLSGKKVSKREYPAISFLWEYTRQADDALDSSGLFPSWGEVKNLVAVSQSRLLAWEPEDMADDDKKRIVGALADLRKCVYQATQVQRSWSEPVSYAEALNYRMNTSILLNRKLAEMGNILVGTEMERRQGVEDAFEAIGVPLQILDDLQDVEEDTDTDGNLVRAALHDSGEQNVFLGKLLQAPDGTNIFKVLRNFAPRATSTIVETAQSALQTVADTSPKVARTVRVCSQVSLDLIKTAKNKKDFSGKFANDMHGKVQASF